MDNQFGAIASFFFDGGESSYQTRSTAVSFGSSNGCSMRSVFAAVRKSKPAMAPAVYAPKLRFSVSGCFRSSLKSGQSPRWSNVMLSMLPSAYSRFIRVTGGWFIFILFSQHYFAHVGFILFRSHAHSFNVSKVINSRYHGFPIR